MDESVPIYLTLAKQKNTTFPIPSKFGIFNYLLYCVGYIITFRYVLIHEYVFS